MNRRTSHLIAYVAAMFALIVWQLIFAYFPALQSLSDFHSDIVYSLVAQILCMGLVPFVCLLVTSKRTVREVLAPMRYKAPRDTRTCVLVTLGLVLLIMPFTMAWSSITQLVFNIFGYKRPVASGTIYTGAGDFFLFLAISAILPAVFEEFSHRGVLLSGLEYRSSERSAIVLSAVLFGLMHESPGQMIYATMGGIVFAYVVVKTDSIIPAMCAHFANNAISTLLDYSRQTQNSLGVWYDSVSNGSTLSVIVTLAILVGSLYAMYKLLQYLSSKAPKSITEGKLLGLVSVDLYNPEGKATLKDNARLYAVIAMQSAVLLWLFLWGIIK